MGLTATDRRNLATLAGMLVTGGVEDDERAARLREAVRGHLDHVLSLPTTSADERERLSAVPAKDELERASAALRRLLLRLLGAPTVDAIRGARPESRRPSGRLDPPADVYEAAIRIALEGDSRDPHDTDTVERWLDRIYDRRHQSMTIIFRAEERGLPAGFDPDDFAKAVSTTLDRVYRLPKQGNEAYHAVVVGKLLLEGQFAVASAGWDDTLRTAYLAGLDTTDGKAKDPETGKKRRIPNHDTYAKVAAALGALPGHGTTVSFQELASVSQHIVDEADAWPVDDTATFGTRVQLGLNAYIEGSADVGFTPLDLPPIVSDDASEQEIEPANVQAVAFIAAGAELEAAGVFDVVDRMVDLFLQGMLPVGNDPGGAALNRYYWDADERLDAAARASQYARVLGAGGGGEVPRDVQPNTPFADLFFRAVSSIARYDADMRVATLFDGGTRDLASSGEYVRKSLHDLAANCSLYGWGFTTFAAKSLKRHVDLAFDVLSEPTLQRSYGVTGPWQLVERVAAIELGSAPNIVQHRTMAKATKDILDLLAKYARQLSVSGANGRFLPGPSDLVSGSFDGGVPARGRDGRARRSELGGVASQGGAVVSVGDYEKLANAAHNVLAVNGMGTEDIHRMSQPTRSAIGPSIPTVGSGQPKGATPDGDGGGALDQIRQLVAQGQVPSLEQLQRLIPTGG